MYGCIKSVVMAISCLDVLMQLRDRARNSHSITLPPLPYRRTWSPTPDGLHANAPRADNAMYGDAKDLENWIGHNGRLFKSQEKLDGIMAIWDGESLYTKNGKRMSPPSQFRAALPPGLPVIGELICGSHSLHLAVALANSNSNHANWGIARFVAFDILGLSDDTPYSQRYSNLMEGVADWVTIYLREHKNSRMSDLPFMMIRQYAITRKDLTAQFLEVVHGVLFSDRQYTPFGIPIRGGSPGAWRGWKPGPAESPFLDQHLA